MTVLSQTWLSASRQYLAVAAAGSLAWEVVQLPLYTLWQTGSAAEIAFAVAHCTGGDVLIAEASLAASLLLFGAPDWPRSRFMAVAIPAVIFGVATTIYSERSNLARSAWTYSNAMPVLPWLGTGLAPLAQWFVVPLLAFAAVRAPQKPGDAVKASGVDLPAVPTTNLDSASGQLARANGRAS